MKKLHLASDLALPADIAGQTLALVGIRGSGKTNTAGVIAEELLTLNQPIVVLDPTDAWWGLRSGYPVFIFGGPHGDLPLQETDGKVLAEFVVTEQVPLILSLRHLRKNAQRRFVTEFCEELYHLKGKDQYRSALTVFIDEAPLFIPQRVMGEVARTVGAVEDLISRGRNSGFGVVLISQRPATVNKDVLSQADTIISHRLTSPQDRKALAEWIEENASLAEYKKVLATLATQKTGQAWVWAPLNDIMWQVQIRERHTFDSSSAPKLGQTMTTAKRLVDVDLDKLKGKLAASIEKAKAEDPKALRTKIADLERMLKMEQGRVATTKTEIVNVPLVTDEQLRALEQSVQSLSAIASTISGAIQAWRGAIKVRHVPARHDTSVHVQTRQRTPKEAREKTVFDGQLSSGERKILTALAQYPGGRTKVQVAILTGYAHTGGGFNNYLSALKGKGWILVDGDMLTITPAGEGVLGPVEPLPSGYDLCRYWQGRLSSGEWKILDYLVQHYPVALSKQMVAEHCGYAVDGGGFNNYVSKLRTLELIEGRTELRASEVFAG